MARAGLKALIGCAIFLLVGCGGGGLNLPPTATPVPPTATATTVPPTATPSPTATVAPTATPPAATVRPTTAPSPTASATRAAGTGTTATRRPSTATRASGSATSAAGATRTGTQVASRAPRGPAPSGWKTYTGTARLPFAIYYPPDWTVDDSEVASDGRVEIAAPTTGISLTMSVDTDRTTVSIDTLRDAQAKGIASVCKASGVERTEQETYSGVVFNDLIQTCDYGTPPLFVFGIGVGLNNGYPWSFFVSSPYDDYNDNIDTYFQPMLDSLNIYANPAP